MSGPAAIDVDRGVTIRQIVKFDDKNPHHYTPDNTFGGLTVYMYDTEPGVYYDVHGKLIPPAIAAKAGYPIEQHAKQRAKRQAMKDFEKKMSDELALELEEEEILADQGDWKVVALSNERAKIVDKETGAVVTAVPMSRKDAFNLLALLTKTADDLHNETVTSQTKKGA